MVCSGSATRRERRPFAVGFIHRTGVRGFSANLKDAMGNLAFKIYAGGMGPCRRTGGLEAVPAGDDGMVGRENFVQTLGIRAPTDHINVRILQNMISGSHLTLGLGTRMSTPSVYVVVWAPALRMLRSSKLQETRP